MRAVNFVTCLPCQTICLMLSASPSVEHVVGATAAGLSRYGSLASTLRGHILSGEWAPGSAIPAETQLAKSCGVALGTMRQAIAVLVSEGLLERVHGRGTFVSNGIGGPSLLRFFRFRAASPDAAATTAVDEVPQSRIVSKRVIIAPPEVVIALDLPPGRRVLALTRVRSLSAQPCLYERIWLPLPLFDALVPLNKSAWDDLLYPMLQRLAGVTVHKAEDNVTFCLAVTDVAEALHLQRGAPCARVARIAFDMAGRRVELRHSFGDALSFHYTAQLR